MTSGPWRSGRGAVRIASQLWEKITTHTGRTVALVLEPQDAALIVAAPEMVELLRDISDEGRSMLGLHIRALLARVEEKDRV